MQRKYAEKAVPKVQGEVFGQVWQWFVAVLQRYQAFCHLHRKTMKGGRTVSVCQWLLEEVGPCYAAFCFLNPLMRHRIHNVLDALKGNDAFGLVEFGDPKQHTSQIQSCPLQTIDIPVELNLILWTLYHSGSKNGVN